MFAAVFCKSFFFEWVINKQPFLLCSSALRGERWGSVWVWCVCMTECVELFYGTELEGECDGRKKKSPNCVCLWLEARMKKLDGIQTSFPMPWCTYLWPNVCTASGRAYGTRGRRPAHMKMYRIWTVPSSVFRRAGKKWIFQGVRSVLTVQSRCTCWYFYSEFSTDFSFTQPERFDCISDVSFIDDQ